MVILNDRPGQLCNRIWACASFIAQALHQKSRLVVPYFGDYAPLFENLNRYSNIWFIEQDNRVYYKATSYFFSLLKALPAPAQRGLHLYIDRARWGVESWAPELLNDKRNTVILSGWNHPKPTESLPDYLEALRAIFLPKPQYTSRVIAFLQQARSTHEVIVGVHLRRGDYREFMGGAYYYSTEAFLAYMRQLAVILASRKVAFLVCSNEVINIADFAELHIIRLPEAQGIEDLYALGLCDYIMGPPSTFSMWASFYGNVPLRILKYKSESITLEDFSPIVAGGTFANGQIFEHIENDYAYMQQLPSTPYEG